MVERLPQSKSKPIIKLIARPLKLLRLLHPSLISIFSKYSWRINEEPKNEAFNKNMFYWEAKRRKVQPYQLDYWGLENDCLRSTTYH